MSTVEDFDSVFTGIGCASVEDIELPSASSAYFNPAEGVHKIRFLQGPVLSYISQEWEGGQPVGDKIKYAHNDPAAKKDPNAKLVMTYLIYNYKEERVQVWEITQKGILEDIKSINGIQPDMSAFDIQITKSKKSNGFMDYKIAQGPNKPFALPDVIAEVVEKGLNKRLAELAKSNEDAPEEQSSIDAQIAAATPAAKPAAAPAQTAAAKAAAETAATVAEAEEVFQ